MFFVILFVLVGLLIGYFLRGTSVCRNLGFPMNLTIFGMLFVLGYTCGSNPDIISRFGNLGMEALIIALSGIIGSAVAASFVVSKTKKGGRNHA